MPQSTRQANGPASAQGCDRAMVLEPFVSTCQKYPGGKTVRYHMDLLNLSYTCQPASYAETIIDRLQGAIYAQILSIRNS